MPQGLAASESTFPEMPDVTLLLLFLALLGVAATLLALQKQRGRAHTIRKKFDALAGEEHRMFSFLHDLGFAIENEPSPSVLSRIIVEGVGRVVAARGAAIYFICADNEHLSPSHISDDCPPLIDVPAEIREKARQDPRALSSYLRLSRVPLTEGILGHCLTLGEPIHVRDLQHHAAFAGANFPSGEGISALLAPLRHAHRDLGVLAVARRHSDGHFTANDFEVFRTAAEQSSFALGNARIHREAHEKRAIESELQNAREVQRILLPQADPLVVGYCITGTNLPARIISGDYYDYIRLGDRQLGIAIADVSGKGVPAGLLMAMCRSTLRSFASGEMSPSKVMTAVNRQLFPDIREDMFISMTYSILDASTGTLTLSRAGHDPALLFRSATGTVELLRSPGLALGIDSGAVFERVTRDQEITLAPGDCVFFYTDGVKEAQDLAEEEFGMERMSEAFRLAAPQGAEAVLARMQETLKAFTSNGPQLDDITLIAISRC